MKSLNETGNDEYLFLQMAFLDHRGLWHSSAKVRSRTAYLFSRFVKSLK